MITKDRLARNTYEAASVDASRNDMESQRTSTGGVNYRPQSGQLGFSAIGG